MERECRGKLMLIYEGGSVLCSLDVKARLECVSLLECPFVPTN
jgi:hypothetical protein